MTEQRIPPKMIVQIWDNDLFSPDDFLGNSWCDNWFLPWKRFIYCFVLVRLLQGNRLYRMRGYYGYSIKESTRCPIVSSNYRNWTRCLLSLDVGASRDEMALSAEKTSGLGRLYWMNEWMNKCRNLEVGLYLHATKDLFSKKEKLKVFYAKLYFHSVLC